MSIQQELQRSHKEWLDKGVEQGVKQAKRDDILGMYAKGLSIPDIADVVKLTVEEVEEILSSDHTEIDK